VALTAFVWDSRLRSFLARTLRVEMEHGRITAGKLRLYHAMYQLFTLTMLVALTTNNMGLLWVAMEAATLSTVLLITLYRTAAKSRSRLEVFHSVRRRHFAGLVWHDPPLFRGRESAGRGGRDSAAVDASRLASNPSSSRPC